MPIATVRHFRLAPVTAAFFLGTIALQPALHAAGEGGTTVTTCPRGQVLDPGSKKCVKAESRAVPDKVFVANAYALAKEQRFEEALAMLDLMEDPETPEALNYRGYATRKLGRLEEGISYYQKAVALDPDYALVREYLGEAYVTQGRFDLARTQLAEVERICGRDCEAYEDLSGAIDGRAVD